MPPAGELGVSPKPCVPQDWGTQGAEKGLINDLFVPSLNYMLYYEKEISQPRLDSLAEKNLAGQMLWVQKSQRKE